MASDDEVNEQTSFDPTFATAGPRRSTFTPPPGSTATPPSSPAVHDDDELANALAADLGRIASGPVPVVNPTAPVTIETADETPAPEGPAPEVAAPEVAPQPGYDPTADDEDPAEDDAADERASTPELQFAPPPAPETMAAPETAAPPPWSSLPAPDPSQAVDLPEGPPQRPVRRSLPEDELLHLGAEQDAGSRIEQLEAQLRLREQEAREFAAWENSMLALGTPDALAAVEDARADFSDVVAPSTGAISIPAAAPVVEDVSPAPEPEAEPEPEPAQKLEPEPEPEPAQKLEPEPEPEPAQKLEPEQEPEPLPEPPAFLEPPTVTGSAPVVAAAAYEVLDEDDESPSPEAALPAWEVPAPSAQWNPTPWEPESTVEPEAVLDPEPEAEPEPTVEVEPLDAVEPEPLVEPLSPFAPPPLVEPPPFGGPPLLPSQASALPPLVDAVPDFRSAASADAEPDIVDAEIVEDAPTVVPPTAASADSGEPFLFGGTPPTPPSREFSFEDLLSGASEEGEEPLLRADPEPATAEASAPESLFIEPLPVAVGEPVPTATGSVAIVEPAYEEEADEDIDDVVDETDRVQTILGLGATQTLPPSISPPSGPISTVRVPDDQTVLIDNEPVAPRAFAIERPGPEPTPLDQRVGRAARLFWLWFAANSSVVSLALGATVFAVGMSLRQSIVAVLAGIALSFIPLGLTTLASKRSGQPTMIVSRATFGLRGNVIPAVIALVSRVFWGAVLLWLVASSVAVVLVGAGLEGPLGEATILLIALGVAFVVAVLVAVAGYGLFARIQLVLSILSGVLVVGFIALTASYVDIAQALTVPDGSWLLAGTGAVLVFSVVGLAWANSGGDLARYQRPGSSGGGSMLWATFGTTLPSFVLIAYGALLAASNEGIARGLATAPLDTIAALLPLWYPVPLLAATVLSLLSGVVLTLYSGAFALQAVGARMARHWSVLVVAALLAIIAALLTLGVSGGMADLFRDAATTLAVPTAAWAGIFAAETMIRNRRFESQSLVQRGGVYADWRWGNLIGYVVITVIGFGLTTATVPWLAWQGYVFSALGVPLDSDLAGTDGGVLVALLLGILLPIVIGIPAIRKQEETRVP